MQTSNEAFREEWKKGLEKLATLRDDIRVKLHLAGMDVKEAWGGLNKEVEAVTQQATEVSRAVITDLTKRLEKLLAKVNGAGGDAKKA